MPLSEQDVDYAIELYNSGATIPDIAHLFDFTKQAISQRFKKRGVKRRPPVIPMTVFEIIEERKRKNYLTDEEIKKRNKAYLVVAKARQEELLPRKPCAVCGEPKSQAHHDDYDKPLDITWLCMACHHQWHNKYGRGMNMNPPKSKDALKSLAETPPKHTPPIAREGCFTAKELLDWRKSYGWSQEEAAREMGVSPDGYRAKEQGRRPITNRDMERIRRVDRNRVKMKATA